MISYVHSEVSLWDATANASNEEKELSWHKISGSFGMTSGKYRMLQTCYPISLKLCSCPRMCSAYFSPAPCLRGRGPGLFLLTTCRRTGSDILLSET